MFLKLFWLHSAKISKFRVQTSDAFWRTAHVLVFELSLKWQFHIPDAILFKFTHFSEIQHVYDGRTD